MTENHFRDIMDGTMDLYAQAGQAGLDFKNDPNVDNAGAFVGTSGFALLQTAQIFLSGRTVQMTTRSGPNFQRTTAPDPADIPRTKTHFAEGGTARVYDKGDKVHKEIKEVTSFAINDQAYHQVWNRSQRDKIARDSVKTQRLMRLGLRGPDGSKIGFKAIPATHYVGINRFDQPKLELENYWPAAATEALGEDGANALIRDWAKQTNELLEKHNLHEDLITVDYSLDNLIMHKETREVVWFDSVFPSQPGVRSGADVATVPLGR